MIKKHKQECRGLNTIDCSGGRMKGSKKRKYDHENATFLSRTRLEKKEKERQHADTGSEEDAVESTSSNTISDIDPFLKLPSDLVPVVVDDMRD